MKCKCEVEIPAARIALGYRVCVECSQEQAVSCVDIIYHKTGNTIQQCSKEQADAIRKASRRSGFGAAAGIAEISARHASAACEGQTSAGNVAGRDGRDRRARA
jgi:hypothetical protein